MAMCFQPDSMFRILINFVVGLISLAVGAHASPVTTGGGDPYVLSNKQLIVESATCGLPRPVHETRIHDSPSHATAHKEAEEEVIGHPHHEPGPEDDDNDSLPVWALIGLVLVGGLVLVAGAVGLKFSLNLLVWSVAAVGVVMEKLRLPEWIQAPIIFVAGMAGLITGAILSCSIIGGVLYFLASPFF